MNPKLSFFSFQLRYTQLSREKISTDSQKTQKSINLYIPYKFIKFLNQISQEKNSINQSIEKLKITVSKLNQIVCEDPRNEIRE